jgi:hypothetical protein
MKFSAAAVSKRDPMPSLRQEEDTNIRGIPSGVGKGSGEQYRDVDASTVIRSPVEGACEVDGRRVGLFSGVRFSWELFHRTSPRIGAVSAPLGVS